MAAGADASSGGGCAVAVVGPSGAGKDTLLCYAARILAGCDDVHFVRRAITRPEEAGGEAHMSMSAAQFEALRQNGGFAVSWDAHDLSYGIPVETIAAVGRGEVVVINGSRAALPAFSAAYPRLVVINITADIDVLAERLSARGRESAGDIRRRLERSAAAPEGDFPVITIENNGAIRVAGDRLVEEIRNLRRRD